MDTDNGITVTRNNVTGFARVEINVSEQARPLAYRVVRWLDGEGYIIRDPFGAAIDGVSTFERAVQIAQELAANVRDWAADNFDC